MKKKEFLFVIDCRINAYLQNTIKHKLNHFKV